MKTTTSKLPQEFLDRISQQYPAHIDRILAGFDREIKTAIQHNFFSSKKPEGLAANPFSEILDQRPVFAHDPHWHAGQYYVQEASSQHLYALIKFALEGLNAPLVADFCAAPGGKSLTALNAMEGRGVLWSNEIISSRANILRENISKWGHGNSIVSSCDTSDLAEMGAQFDLILVDAPCSGEGMFRRDQIAIDEWNPGLPKMCAERQSDILTNAYHSLKPGGRLLYSTCTMAEEENDAQARWLIEEYGFQSLQFDGQAFGAMELEHGWLFTPGAQHGEGLYFCLLEKPQEEAWSLKGARKKGIDLLPRKREEQVKNLLPEIELNSYTFFENKQGVRALTESMIPLLDSAKQVRIPILQAGFALGIEKSGKWVPAHELSMMKRLPMHFNEVPLDFEQALRFLQLEDPQIQAKGWVMVTFEGSRLGWVKAMGNRNNNYYPKHWKLRKGL